MSGDVVEWGVATGLKAGQVVSGDRHVVVPFEGGVLAGVVDGLGHGREAASAAERCVATLQRHACEALVPMLTRCHEALRSTRGVAISVASFTFHDNMMTWLGVGNVAGVLVHADGRARAKREHLLIRGGVVGGNLPSLRSASLSLQPGDLLIFATDGVREEFVDSVEVWGAPDAIAHKVVKGHAKGTDDSLALVVRYLGSES